MKLWQKNSNLNKEVEQFTVGNDYLLDQKLLKYDVAASIAHSTMLKKIGILTAAENNKLQQQLTKILDLDKQGKFKIAMADEDSHTAIENYLTKKLGETGKKIHTARSRNDQVLAALRLYVREELEEIATATNNLIKTITIVANKNKGIPIPGYTHMQKAMPSSVSLWLDSFKDALEDDLMILTAAKKLINQNPLGSGAGYGLPIKVDRKLTAKLLKFEKVQDNPVYVQNSRGKFELLVLQSLQQLMLSLNKLATDLMLFLTSEYGYVSLPEELCTGSSIMPQKKNPDVIELLRAKTAMFGSYCHQIESVITNLPGGYNRDFQLTKEPLMKGIETAKECIRITAVIVGSMHINKANCKAAMTDELFATEKAYKLVKKGLPFREAYNKVKQQL